MRRYYLEALTDEEVGRVMVKELVDWLSGEYHTVDSYDLAQFMFEMLTAAPDAHKEITRARVTFLAVIAQKQRNNIEIKSWDMEFAMLLVAIICSKHKFAVEGV